MQVVVHLIRSPTKNFMKVFAHIGARGGSKGIIKNFEACKKLAKEVTYPVMLKASAGGGGKGMRIAYDDQQCADGFIRAQNESLASFGDNRVFAEKYIAEPHHIEIQILADQQGHTIYLGERECSIQRRYQKVVEEAPSPFIDNKTRIAMGEQAVALAKAVNYESAGTVEFIVDKNQKFYFLEMNTRLQVEHPVTEMVTGLDLVEEMIRIASGEVLKFSQKDLQVTGSAIETRIYAEDPYRDFMPSIGRVSKYCVPNHLDFIRIDTGIEEGSDVSMFYDPMIAKLIANGEDREQSIDRMLLALDQFHISGVSHNINFLSSIMQNKKYREGYTTTNFIQEQFPDGFQGEIASENETLVFVSVLACIHQNSIERYQTVIVNETKQSSWSVSFNKKKIDLMIKKSSKTTEILIDSSVLIVDLVSTPNNPIVKARVNDDIYYFQLEKLHPGYRLTYRGRILEALVTSNRTAELNQLMPKKKAPDLSKFLLSPMPGLLIKICVKEGQHIKAGEELAIVEAMKMENSLRAIDSLTIKSILTKEGDNLMVDQTILEFED